MLRADAGTPRNRRFRPWLRNLSAEGRRLLVRGMREVRAVPAATLLRKGDAVSGAYLVLAGRLRVYTLTPRGTEATLYFIEPGETCVLALNCLFNDLRYPAWVQADEASRIGVIPGALYRLLFEQEPPVQALTVRSLSVAVFRLMAELERVHSTRPRRINKCVSASYARSVLQRSLGLRSVTLPQRKRPRR